MALLNTANNPVIYKGANATQASVAKESAIGPTLTEDQKAFIAKPAVAAAPTRAQIATDNAAAIRTQALAGGKKFGVNDQARAETITDKMYSDALAAHDTEAANATGGTLVNTDNRGSTGLLNTLSNSNNTTQIPASPVTNAQPITSLVNTSPVAQTVGQATAPVAPANAVTTPASSGAPATVTNPASPASTASAANGTGSSNYIDQINPATDTVEGRINNLLKTDNPLIQTARTQAAQAANSRGLLNSSIGVQAGEQAAIESARSIASQDAQAYNTQRQGNQEMEQATWTNYLQAITNVQIQQIPEADKKIAMENINAIVKGNPRQSFVNTWKSMP